ncbi:MAG: xanthine dehydrogenase family protein subunit M [Deltaproteobacteria bacterium]|nr:xanthine dehydrogenase family protein subunit M [Deltaproteobacteria bacterium]
MVTFYRRMPKMDYFKPGSLEEVLELLRNSKNGKYRVYAGGTDVIPKLKGRVIKAPEVLVDLKGISDLDSIDFDDEKGLRIGALATVRSVETSSIIKERYPILSQAAGSIASIQVRNRGTIAGNICNAVPSADSAPALLCLDADLLCEGNAGESVIPITEFFQGPNLTVLKPNEILKEIRIPKSPKGSRGVYLKLSPRSRMDLAVVGVGVLLTKTGGAFHNVRIGLGAVAPTPVRAVEAEAMLEGSEVNDKLIADAAKRASEEARPIDDHRASAEYRRMMVEVLVRRAINQCLSD